MIRRNISINEYEYQVELYKAVSDLNNSVSKKYVMLRKFYLTNNIAYDTDIYFIEKDLFWKVTGLGTSEEKVILTDGTVIFPVCDTRTGHYSNYFTDFNPDYTEENLKTDFYYLYERKTIGTDASSASYEYEEAYVHCDKIRIYHPNVKPTIDAIVEVDDYINGIHFHYICKKYDSFKYGCAPEFKVNNNIYSEYVEFLIPSVEHLFGKTIFYAEDLNVVNMSITDEDVEDYSKKILTEKTEPIITEMNPWAYIVLESYEEFHDHILIEDSDNTITEDPNWSYIVLETYANYVKSIYTDLIDDKTDMDEYGCVFCSLYLLTVPFKISTSDDEESILYGKKIFMPEIRDAIESNYMTYPITITMYPYDRNNIVNGIYIADPNLNYNKNVFSESTKFSLKASFNFINGEPAVVTQFEWPNKERFAGFKEAYEHFNNVSFDEYQKNLTVTDEDDILEEDYEIRQECAFKVEIASDPGFKHIIYSKYVDAETPDEFAFGLSNIFKSWKESPEILTLRTTFIDKYVGISIKSNLVVINKEMFKYLTAHVNDTYRLQLQNGILGDEDESDFGIPKLLTEVKNNIITEMVPWHYIILESYNGFFDRMFESDSDSDSDNDIDYNMGNKIEFIDKITCIVKPEAPQVEVPAINTGSPTILYKPVFYKVQDLQTIQVRAGLVQNVGINLAPYMTKVDTFTLTIGGQSIKEYARNDVYVIFRLPANAIVGTNGVYHITDQDDEYISSGNWTVTL